VTLATLTAPLATSIPDSSPWAFWSYFLDHRSDDLGWFVDHATLSAIPVVLGLVIAFPLGWLAARFRWAYTPLITITGLLYTIPSIALFVLIPPLLGLKALDPLQVPIALTIYSVALLTRVIADGLGSVPTDVVQAANAIGYTPLRRLTQVELPIAVPVIAAGLRVAAVSNVSMVAIAGTIGQTNLGYLMYTQGFQLSTPTAYYPPIVLGIVGCVVIALVFDVVIIGGTRLLTPWRHIR